MAEANGNTWIRWALGIAIPLLLGLIMGIFVRLEWLTADFNEHCYASQGRFTTLEQKQVFTDQKIEEILRKTDDILWALKTTRGNSRAPERPYVP